MRMASLLVGLGLLGNAAAIPPTRPIPLTPRWLESQPKETEFDSADALPFSFSEFLRLNGYTTQGSALLSVVEPQRGPLTNGEALGLFRKFTTRSPANTPVEAPPGLLRLDWAKGLTWKAVSAGSAFEAIGREENSYDDISSAAGEGAAPAARQAPRQGLTLGVEIMTGRDGIDEPWTEPYARKGDPGLDKLVDLRARVRIDSLGASLRLTKPRALEFLAVSYDHTMDVPRALKLGDLRDKIWSLIGKSTGEEVSGYRVWATAVFNEFWGLKAEHYEKTVTRTGSLSRDENSSLRIAYTPLGRNEDHPWNYTFLFSLRHDDRLERGSGRDVDREGPGAAVGVAFQRALNHILLEEYVPAAWAKELARHVLLDRGQLRLELANTALEGLVPMVAVGLMTYVTRYVLLFLEVNGRWLAEKGGLDFGFSTGLAVNLDARRDRPGHEDDPLSPLTH